ncbi:MAG TPA: aminotransferase class V-fold PLP-dependent enzyme, partial [Afifellaceae bacterium]|nr:aminotransferase class V-fold PLP-dependent enzyme [Afifellaceae bacterium]
TLSPGDRVLACVSGFFAQKWSGVAERLGLTVEVVEGDWRCAVDPASVRARLHDDRERTIRAVAVVHNETSTGCASSIPDVRKAMDAAGHDALLMVDTISSLASIDYRHDEWGVDVTVAGSQKGLMLPPGLSFNAISEKALEASKTAGLARSYWAWDEMAGPNEKGYFPYTPATNLLYGLVEAIDMLHEEGLENVFARHQRHGQAARRAVQAWELEVFCTNPNHYSGSLTAVLMPEGHSADAFRRITLEHFDMSLGNGLSKIADKVFRIGHLGDFNDLMLSGTLSGVEMGLELSGVPYQRGGVQAALDFLTARDQVSVAAE